MNFLLINAKIEIIFIFRKFSSLCVINIESSAEFDEVKMVEVKTMSDYFPRCFIALNILPSFLSAKLQNR